MIASGPARATRLPHVLALSVAWATAVPLPGVLHAQRAARS